MQDRSFTTDSQLWYPVANNPAGSTLPAGVLHPRWIPEYSATVGAAGAQPVNYVMMTVNGRTYPRHVSWGFVGVLGRSQGFGGSEGWWVAASGLRDDDGRPTLAM